MGSDEFLDLCKKIVREYTEEHLDKTDGKEQYIELATNVSFKTPNDEVINVDHIDMGNKAIAFHGTSGVQLGWLASQSDMLSEDWTFVE